MKTVRFCTTALGIVVLVIACATNRAALNASMSNKLFIGQVQIGQTMDQVRHEMHKGPESQNVSTLPDGAVDTVWNYVTDYGNDINTSITFRDGKVTAINQTHWLGNGNFSNATGPMSEEVGLHIDKCRPTDVTISSIDVQGGIGVVSVEGVSATPSGINDLVQHIRADAFFSGVSIARIESSTGSRRFKLLLSLAR
jgi:major membrane immunogen (membrane-anchored lipoprotein)